MVRKNWFMNRTRRKTLLNIVGTDGAAAAAAGTYFDPRGVGKAYQDGCSFPQQEIDQLSEAQNKSLRF